MLDIPYEVAALRHELSARADSAYRAGSMMVMKTDLEVIGVRAPALREIVKQWTEAHRMTPWEETLTLADALFVGPSLEERALALVLMERHRREIGRLDWSCFERWKQGLDSWGMTDGLGCLVFGPWLAADFKSRQEALWRLIADKDFWSRRLALVGTVPLNRTTTTAIPDITLELIDRVKHERDPMMTKAVSWALRALIKHHKARVAQYVEANRDELAALVVREVGNKLRTGLKSGKKKGS